MRRLALGLVGLVVTAGTAGAQPPQPPTELRLTFDERAVTARGATPSGKVAWFSVAREIGDYAARIVRREAMVDASAAGEADFRLEETVPRQSIWVAVDVQTGGFGVGTPADFELRQLVLGAGALGPGAGDADVLTVGRNFLEVFLVRPKKAARPGAAYAGTVGDGGISDVDSRPDGAVVLPLTRLHPIGASEELLQPVFTPDDLLAVIDPNAMAVGVVRVSTGARQ